jgi:hypothetical protein
VSLQEILNMRKVKQNIRSTGSHNGPRRSQDIDPGEAPAPYTAYAIAADGSRHVLNARYIVVDIGLARVRMDLQPSSPVMSGKLHVTVEGEGILMVGPGDANSINLGVAPSRSGRRGGES